MSNQKHTVATDALETLGTLLDGVRSERDAIHLAVEPVIAGTDLKPGQRIGISPIDGRAVSEGVKIVGIVDPFLTEKIYAGDRFWLVVLPRQITSLRHVWSHPDFPEAVQQKEDASVEWSKQWIETFAERINQTYDKVMAAAELWVATGEWTYDNSETYKDHWDDFDEFWRHYGVVTGQIVPQAKRESFFTCSC